MNSALRLIVCDDAAVVVVSPANPLRVPCQPGRRSRAFSFAVVGRYLSFASGQADGIAGRTRFPFICEFRRAGTPVYRWRFHLREQTDAGIVIGQFDATECVIPGVSVTGWNNALAAGAEENWMGCAQGQNSSDVSIPFRTEYDAAGLPLREVRQLNLKLIGMTIDADELVLFSEMAWTPTAISGNSGTLVMAAVCLSQP
jgi:hypothetical protein